VLVKVTRDQTLPLRRPDDAAVAFAGSDPTAGGIHQTVPSNDATDTLADFRLIAVRGERRYDVVKGQ
jgi:hypothetical protein